MSEMHTESPASRAIRSGHARGNTIIELIDSCLADCEAAGPDVNLNRSQS